MTVRSRLRTVFADNNSFETFWHVSGGDVHIDYPDMRNAQSMCCPTGIFHSTYRWSGTRLVLTKRTETKRAVP